MDFMDEKDFIEKELVQILSSRLLESKKQACNFLSYIVTETLLGRGDKITQYAIAIDALGKPLDFCPTESPAVRVEAGRVRKLLEAYYASEGQHSKVRIVLPSGSYQPVFEHVTPEAPTTMPTLEPKSIQSLGPKIHISYQDTALIRDSALRGLVYNMRSVLPMLLGNFREVRIGLAQANAGQRRQTDQLESAWRRHQADFLLQCTADVTDTGFDLRFILVHTQTREEVWAQTLPLSLHHTQQTLEAIFSQVIQETFSLHRGVAMAYWSRYWKSRDSIPSHHQVLVEHVTFIQDSAGNANLQAFLEACQTRTQRYHDDALAHLHYAVLCLYAYMLGDTSTPLETQWHRLALRALELNPGNALAHSIFALECFHRGDREMGQMEIDIARQVNPSDSTSGHLMAVGLCALRQWELAFTLMRDIAGLESGHPDPRRTVPCLFYFRRGEFARIATATPQYTEIGGWETFGKLVNHCRTDDCKGCIQTISQAVDKVIPHGSALSNNRVWTNVQHRLPQSSSARLSDITLHNTTLQ
jgi:hypothetical protein